MGGQQSREEIEDDGDNTIVGVSEEVAKRLLRQVNNPESSEESDDSSKPQSKPFETEATFLSKKEQVKMFEDYYKRQLDSLKEQNKILKETSQEQFQATIKEVENKFPEPLKQTLVCKELQDVMVGCYMENKGATLNCSHEVKTFVDCVQKHNQLKTQESS